MAQDKRPADSDLAAQPLTVLVVDDEKHVLTSARRLLQAFQLAVVVAESTAEALHLVHASKIDVALIDWRLGGSEDGLALGRCLTRDRGIPFVLFSGYMTTESTAQAIRQGAVDVVDKPLSSDRLLAALQFAISHRGTEHFAASLSLNYGSDPVSRRWADLALRACRALKDPNTELAVASASAVSTSVFRKICAACSVSGRDSRDLIRFLRAEALSKEDGSMLRTHLSASDPRTLAALFARASLPIEIRFVPFKDFMLNQRFIWREAECFRVLTHLAANDPLFFAEFHFDRPGSRVKRA